MNMTIIMLSLFAQKLHSKNLTRESIERKKIRKFSKVYNMRKFIIVFDLLSISRILVLFNQTLNFDNFDKNLSLMN